MVFLLLLDAIVHPIFNASTLMQVGYEPVPPYESTSLFGSPALALPNVFDYCWHMRARDGVWTGWYRGLGATLCANLCARLTAELVLLATSCSDDDVTPELYNEMSVADRQWMFLRSAARTVLAQAVCVVTSQPLRVVAVRTMAQFVGMETKYRGVFSGVAEAVSEGGASALFSGLVPRFIGDVGVVVIAATVTYVLDVYVTDGPDMRLVWGFSYWAACKLMHPFQVVALTMAVNDCGLAAGTPPRMPVYSGWTHCWNHLYAGGQIMRGDRYFWRYAPAPGLAQARADKPAASKAL